MSMTYRPFTRAADLPANGQGQRTVLEAHLDLTKETLGSVVERLVEATFSSGGVVVAGTVTNPSAAVVQVVGRMGVSQDVKTVLAVGSQTVDLAAVATSTKCLVIIRAQSGGAQDFTFTDATTGEVIVHSIMTNWGHLDVVEGDATDYPALPADAVAVAEVTKTGAATLTLDSVITAAPTPRYTGPTSAPELTVNAQTGTTYTFVLADGDGETLVTFDNAGAITATIPANASVPYPVGTILSGAQLGGGLVTLAGATGVTINGTTPGSEASAGQWSSWSLVKLATDSWLASGGLA